MQDIRPASVAGSFYPANPAKLKLQLSQLLESPKSLPISNLRALIVPHAGYQYSGKVAADAFAALEKQQHRIKRVAIIGPCHRVWIDGMAIPTQQGYATPLGVLPIDRRLLAQLSEFSGVEYSDIAHAQEHSIEVQLPFLQQVLPQASIVPVLVGDASTQQVATVIEALFKLPDCLVLVSSDLSHFLDYDSAKIRDRRTTELILQKDFDALDHEMACGSTPIRGLLCVAKQHNLEIDLISQCNSGDTAGDKSRVVGYASYAVY